MYYIRAQEKESLVEGKQYVNMCGILGASFHKEDEIFAKKLGNLK